MILPFVERWRLSVAWLVLVAIALLIEAAR